MKTTKEKFPALRGKKEAGKYLVLESQDKRAWVVCGHNCAERVNKCEAFTTKDAVRLALQRRA